MSNASLRSRVPSSPCLKDGAPVDGVSYPTLVEAAAALEKAGQGGEVTAVDGLDKIVRRYTAEECRNARNFR